MEDRMTHPGRGYATLRQTPVVTVLEGDAKTDADACAPERERKSLLRSAYRSYRLSVISYRGGTAGKSWTRRARLMADG